MKETYEEYLSEIHEGEVVKIERVESGLHITEYKLDGKLHSVSDEVGSNIIPARVIRDVDGRALSFHYMHHGKTHRDGAPAYIKFDKEGCITQRLYFNQGIEITDQIVKAGAKKMGIIEKAQSKWAKLKAKAAKKQELDFYFFKIKLGMEKRDVEDMRADIGKYNEVSIFQAFAIVLPVFFTAMIIEWVINALTGFSVIGFVVSVGFMVWAMLNFTVFIERGSSWSGFRVVIKKRK